MTPVYAQGFLDGLDGGPFNAYEFQQSSEYRRGYREGTYCAEMLVCRGVK